MNGLKKIMVITLCCCNWLVLPAQERGMVREGNQLYIEGTVLERDSINQAYAKWDQATAKYSEAFKLDSSLVEAVFNMGDVAYKKGDFDKAIEKFEEAAGSTGDDSIKYKANYNIGNCYLRQYDYEKSVDYFKRALRLNPHDMDAKYNLAYAQSYLKKEEGAGDDQEDKKKPEPSEYAKKLKAAAEELIRKRQYSEAFDTMEQGKRIDTTVVLFQKYIDKVKKVADLAPADTAASKK